MPRPRKNSDPEHEGLTPDQLALFASKAIDPALPKTAQVFELLRRAIVGLVLPPGAILNEKQICEQLGLSRTPLREAILLLSAENLVSVVPNSGTRVTKIDLSHVFDGQLVRHSLELRITRIAADRMNKAFAQELDFNMYRQRQLAAAQDFSSFYDVDEDMHRLICEFGSSPKIWKIVTGAKAQLDRVRCLAIPQANHLEIVLNEHAAIVDALKRGDADGAVNAMAVHLERVFETIRLLMRERGEYFVPYPETFLQRFKDLSA